DVAMLEHALRDDLNKNAPRAMAVLRPPKVAIENLPEGHGEMLRADYHPEPALGARDMPFTRELFIEQDDFKEGYTKKFKQTIPPSNRIRLRHSYVIEATGYEKDADGNVVLVTAKLIEGTLGTDPADDIKPKGVVHWVSATECKEAELRLYERLFTHQAPDKTDGDFMEYVIRNSLKIITAFIEPALAEVAAESNFQFEREGYYVADRYDHAPAKPVFNLTIGLREDK